MLRLWVMVRGVWGKLAGGGGRACLGGRIGRFFTGFGGCLGFICLGRGCRGMILIANGKAILCSHH